MRPAAHRRMRALAALLFESLDVEREGLARGPRTERRRHERRRRLHARSGDEAFEHGPSTSRCLARRRVVPGRCSRLRSRRPRGVRLDAKTGGSPKRPRRSTMIVRDGPGAAQTPSSRKARAELGAPPMTAPAPPRSTMRRANSSASTPSTQVRASGSNSSPGALFAARLKRRRTRKPAKAATIVSAITIKMRMTNRLSQKLLVCKKVHAVVVLREVVGQRGEQAPEVNGEKGDEWQPDPRAEASIEGARGDEALDGGRVLEPVGVGEVLAVHRVRRRARSCQRRPRGRARPRGGDLENRSLATQIPRCSQQLLGALVIAQLGVVAAGQHEERVRFLSHRSASARRGRSAALRGSPRCVWPGLRPGRGGRGSPRPRRPRRRRCRRGG